MMRLKEAKALVRRYGRRVTWVSEKPNTYVRIEYRNNQMHYIGHGFAKWNVTDEGVKGLDWDQIRGFTIAKGRAVADIARQLTGRKRSLGALGGLHACGQWLIHGWQCPLEGPAGPYIADGDPESPDYRNQIDVCPTCGENLSFEDIGRTIVARQS